jgi:hypothetical protein
MIWTKSSSMRRKDQQAFSKVMAAVSNPLGRLTNLLVSQVVNSTTVLAATRTAAVEVTYACQVSAGLASRISHLASRIRTRCGIRP